MSSLYALLLVGAYATLVVGASATLVWRGGGAAATLVRRGINAVQLCTARSAMFAFVMLLLTFPPIRIFIASAKKRRHRMAAK
tara:strand:- start:336 stop:584 length:249 start_codon:yes stop_codon:yes gene_type:complete